MSWEIPGIKLAYMVAGFAGGVVSLRYVKNLNWWQGLSSVLGGTLTANYLTPVVQFYLKMEQPQEYGTAFIVGLVALNLLAGVFKLSEKWKEDPTLPGQGGAK